MVAAASVLVSSASRPLRRSLKPIEWMVLEDLALDATDEGGRLVAATSARQIAEHLGITPGCAAKALSRLGSLSLVAHARRPGPEGRFGLSVYELTPPPGLEVVGVPDALADRPSAPPPCAASPCSAAPCAAGQHMAEGHVTGAGTSSGAQTKTSKRPRRAVQPAPARDVQLDLLAPVAASPTRRPTDAPRRSP